MNVRQRFRDLVTPDCAFCLDGFTPAGSAPILGDLYLACTACRRACPACGGLGVFPAAYRDLADFTAHLAEHQLGAGLCPHCWGVLALIPLDQVGGLR